MEDGIVEVDMVIRPCPEVQELEEAAEEVVVLPEGLAERQEFKLDGRRGQREQVIPDGLD